MILIRTKLQRSSISQTVMGTNSDIVPFIDEGAYNCLKCRCLNLSANIGLKKVKQDLQSDSTKQDIPSYVLLERIDVDWADEEVAIPASSLKSIITAG